MIHSEAELHAAIVPVYSALPREIMDAMTVLGAVTTGVINLIDPYELRERMLVSFTDSLLVAVRKSAGRLD